MLPFTLVLRAGAPVHEPVVYAVKKAIVSERLRPGDEFPSVRTLSRELRINPNTAHKVVATLIGDGMLEVRPGIGTIVTARPSGTADERRALLREAVERLVVEARHLSLDRDDVVKAVVDHWDRLGKKGR